MLALLLVFLLEPALAVPDQDPVAPAAVGLAAFALLYAAVIVSALGLVPMRWVGVWLELSGLGLLAALAVTLSAAFGQLPVMVLVAPAGVVVLPSRWGVHWVIGTVAAQGAVVAMLGGGSGEGWFWLAFSTALVGTLTIVGRRNSELIGHLHRTRAELAEQAVETERLRFSRDLHDLLGHTLSLLVVKAEVANRSAHRDPDAAAREAGEIAQIGRQALAEVREAVTGYRERSFAAELDSARTALAGAGVAVTVRACGTPLPAPADGLFGWVVREAATNVVRHSRARHCEIAVSREDGTATLEVRDDGGGDGSRAPGGRGLSGLSERLAEAGGRLEAGAAAGGWRVRATVPS